MKKSNRWLVFWCLIGLAAWGGVVWLALSPAPPVPLPPSVHVKVAPLPPVEPPAEQATPESDVPMPPVAGMEGVVVPEPTLPALPPMVPGMPKTAAAKTAPKIAIVIDDMGLNIAGSERAEHLPKFITLSYMSYAPRIDEQTGQAHEDGHELMLHMPMEPVGHNDPGPGALLTSLSPDEIRARFVKALGSFEGFDGVNNHMGSKFTAYAPGMEIVIDELQKRHLFFLDSRTSPATVGESIAKQHDLPTVGRDVFLDDDMSPAAIKTQLARTEYVARRQGHAIAIGHPHDVTLDALEAWLPEAQKRGFVFVPVHDLVAAPPVPAKGP